MGLVHDNAPEDLDAQVALAQGDASLPKPPLSELRLRCLAPSPSIR